MGADADITIFDPATVADRLDHRQPGPDGHGHRVRAGDGPGGQGGRQRCTRTCAPACPSSQSSRQSVIQGSADAASAHSSGWRASTASIVGLGRRRRRTVGRDPARPATSRARRSCRASTSDSSSGSLAPSKRYWRSMWTRCGSTGPWPRQHQLVAPHLEVGLEPRLAQGLELRRLGARCWAGRSSRRHRRTCADRSGGQPSRWRGPKALSGKGTSAGASIITR